MPVYKDETRGTWYCCFHYKDWQGVRRKKMKRGFAKQRDAKEWERMFLDKLQGTPNMTFGSLVSLYMDDMKNRLRLSTMSNKQFLIDLKILPYFKEMTVDEIKPTTIRQWQNTLMGRDFAPTYLKSMHNQLCAIFNYALMPNAVGYRHCRESHFDQKRNVAVSDIMNTYMLDALCLASPCALVLPSNSRSRKKRTTCPWIHLCMLA